MIPKESKIYVTGHTGLVGSAILRELQKQGYTNLVSATSSTIDLRKQSETLAFFTSQNPEYVILAAGKVGGILANSTYPADFIYDNLMIECNIIKSAFETGVKKLLFLGSSCIYPKLAPQPIREEYFLSDYLEPTNDAYAIAKIAGIKLCQSFNQQYGTNYISAMPTNLYGYFDNFDLQTSHVLPGLISKFHEAKINNYETVTIWGTGTPRREFLFVDDLAEACIYLMNQYNGSEIINVGCGTDLTILELARMIKEIVGFKGELQFDHTKPDGTPQKRLDISKMENLGWKSKTTLQTGIKLTYDWYTSAFIS